jgi:hypothetical protein
LVLAFAAIELVPLSKTIGANKNIVAIAAIEDILSLACLQLVVPAASVDDVVAKFSLEIVSTAKATYLVIAIPSEDIVATVEATYLVIANLPAQLVCFVGAYEQATLGVIPIGPGSNPYPGKRSRSGTEPC